MKKDDITPRLFALANLLLFFIVVIFILLLIVWR